MDENRRTLFQELLRKRKLEMQQITRNREESEEEDKHDKER